jgi:hypothetical protein
MKAAIKLVFAGVSAVLYAVAAYAVLWSALRTAMFEPNDAHTFLLDTIGAAIIAFIAAQLGIAMAGGGGGRSFAARVRNAMGSESKWAVAMLAIDAAIFLVAGLGFVVLWVRPDLIAVPTGNPELTNAPDYIATRAKAFVGVTLAALAGLAPSTTD